MSAWALPAAAAAFWAGLLAWEVRPSWARPWMGDGASVCRRSPARGWPRRAPRPAMIRSSTHGTRRARAGGPRRREPHRVRGRRFAAHRGRAGDDRPGRCSAPAGRACTTRGSTARCSLGSRRSASTVVGSLHTDPEAGAFGWHATLDVTRVEWPGGAASLRESVWLSADGDPPPWVRGDVVTRRRRDPPPRRSRVPRCARSIGGWWSS